MKRSPLQDAFSALDVVVLERVTAGSFHLVGTAPDWFRALRPNLARARKPFRPDGHFPFLENFLEEAGPVWSRKAPRSLKSGIWSETGPSGEEFHLEASAVRTEGGMQILLIERLGSSYDERQALLQRGRELRLDYDRLARTEAKLKDAYAQLENTHDDLLSILNQLRLGVAMTDREGGLIFLNDSAQKIFGKRSEEVRGRPLEGALPLRREDRARVRALSEPGTERPLRVPLHIEVPGGRHYWMEVDVRGDPRDPDRKIYFFYDLTEIHDLRRMLSHKARFHDLVGKSKPMILLYQQIQEVARVDSTALIVGETGSGKELVARALHASGHRKDGPFIAVNCAGMTEPLVASQLFGHRRGAFTGAIADQLGVFEVANAGTLFLDEIGDIPLNVQTSLLRVLQEKEISRVGEAKPRKVDVRVLAATQRDLKQAVAGGSFRSDLFFRIQVARIAVPPLRERREDIPLLVAAFLAETRATTGKDIQDVSSEAMRLLLEYGWPGNVRELKSTIEFASIRCKGSLIQEGDLPPEIGGPLPAESIDASGDETDERDRVLSALKRAGGNRTVASTLLGISRATLYRKLTSLEIPNRKLID